MAGIACSGFDGRRKSSVGLNGITVEISVGCRNLRDRDRFSRSDPVCVLRQKTQRARQWTEVGRTERVKNTENPQWSKTFILNYRFEERQQLRFAIYDWDKYDGDYSDQDDLGTIECTLGEILATRGKFERGLSPYRHTPGDCGVLIAIAEERSGTKDKIMFEFNGSNLDKKDLFSDSDPFFTISRLNHDGTEMLVYRSEWIKNNNNPEWKMVEILLSTLCNGDWDRQLRIHVYDYDDSGNHDYIGEFVTSVDQMSDGEGFQILQWDVINAKKREKKGNHYKNSGTVILKSFKFVQDSTFLDFIRGGMKLDFVVAVDFTQSNGDPRNIDSLHHLDRYQCDNAYTLAIRTIGEIFQDYDYDDEKKFLALGFGGLINGRTSHCFPLNGNPRNPQCLGIEGVIEAYYDSLESVPLSDPTYFTPIIDYLREKCERNHLRNGHNYTVLLIITDGGIRDLETTQNRIIEISHLPISIVVAVVGSEPEETLKKMRILGDEAVDRELGTGVRMSRDIVHFVELSKYFPKDGNSPDGRNFETSTDAANIRYHLSKDVLAEIPQQISEYMKMHNFLPGIPQDGSEKLGMMKKMSIH